MFLCDIKEILTGLTFLASKALEVANLVDQV